MKKALTMFLTVMFFLAMHVNTLAAEDRPTIPYFGLGATVQEVIDGEFLVKTEGAKKEEGFVYTPPQPFEKENIRLQITLKGKGTVILKIEETNARGQFIKDKTTEVTLTEDWATYEMSFTLESPSSQIDASVITKSKDETEFSFKNLQIIEE